MKQSSCLINKAFWPVFYYFSIFCPSLVGHFVHMQGVYCSDGELLYWASVYLKSCSEGSVHMVCLELCANDGQKYIMSAAILKQ